MPSSPADDYYVLLGLDANARDDELRRAWRELAARHHPDRAGEGATATFQRLSAAYTVLSDPVARAAYDRRRRRGTASSTTQAPTESAASRPTPRDRPTVPATMLSRVCGSLTTLMACGAVELDEPGFITLVLREAEAARGGMSSISMRVGIRCPHCAAALNPPIVRCTRCDGTGVVEELFSAWLAVPPGVPAGEVLVPSVELPGMIEPVRFRVRLAETMR